MMEWAPVSMSSLQAYSSLIAFMGSRRDARRAGSHDAVTAMIVNSTTIAANVIGSVGLTPTSMLAITRVMASMLVGVNPTDPITFAAIVVLFTIIAVTASWLPARRASRLDPMNAIREE